MMALIDMRLGDVCRREGKLVKATRHYSSALEAIQSLPPLLVASYSVGRDVSF
jgi:hypothetical protein